MSTVKQTEATPGPAAEPETIDVELLHVAQLHEHPDNPRKHFDKAKLSELTASVKEQGVLSPLLVRPMGDTGYQILAGARRFRAAEAAGLETVPCIIYELEDVDALEIMMTENLQREDLHPMEEAEGYHVLHEKVGQTVEDIATRLGKSVGYVQKRLRLMQLVPAARKAFMDGKLGLGIALMLARIPDKKLQAAATADVTRAYTLFLEEAATPPAGLEKVLPADDGLDQTRPEPLTAAQAARLIQTRYMLQLGNAQWHLDDAELLPAAGACSTCPKRTGNQRALFDDVANPDTCTDPMCFAQKREAAWQRRAELARQEGRTVIDTPAQVQKLHVYGDQYKGHVNLDAVNHEDPKGRTWRKLLGPAAVSHVTLLRDEEQNLVELLTTDKAKALLKERGHDFKRGASSAARSSAEKRYKAEREKAAAKVRREATLRRAVFDALRPKLRGVPERGDLAIVAQALLAASYDQGPGILELLGVEVPKKAREYGSTAAARAGAAYFSTLDAKELQATLVVMALAHDLKVREYRPDPPRHLFTVAERHGVRVDALRKELLAAEREKAKAKKKAPAKKGKKKPATKKAATKKKATRAQRGGAK